MGGARAERATQARRAGLDAEGVMAAVLGAPHVVVHQLPAILPGHLAARVELDDARELAVGKARWLLAVAFEQPEEPPVGQYRVDPRNQCLLFESIIARMEARLRDVLETDSIATSIQASQHRDLAETQWALAVEENAQVPMTSSLRPLQCGYTHFAGSMRPL